MLCSTESVFRLIEPLEVIWANAIADVRGHRLELAKTVDEHQIGVDARKT